MKKFLLLAAMMVALCASAQSYSLVGYINGADYGWYNDADNPGTYLFDENGKLTATFNQVSYVFVKLTDNSKWFLTQNYVDFTGNSATATMVNGQNYGEKMRVPGNKEVTFTLTEVDENTITLTASVAPEPMTACFMKHNWGGGGDDSWTWKEATKVEGTDGFTLQEVYGGSGVNVNSAASDAGAKWFAEPTVGGDVAVGDLCVFTYFEGQDYVRIDKVVPTAINDINVTATKAYKTIENGQVIIVKDNVRYNVMGQPMK